jgi:hypothetical protein
VRRSSTASTTTASTIIAIFTIYTISSSIIVIFTIIIIPLPVPPLLAARRTLQKHPPLDNDGQDRGDKRKAKKRIE